MVNSNSLVPVVANAAVEVSGTITSLIAKAKTNGVIQRAKLEMLKDQTMKVLADARAYHVSDIVTVNLEQLAKTQEHIDYLERQGRLHGASLIMAMDQLGELNNILRRNLQKFENRELR